MMIRGTLIRNYNTKLSAFETQSMCRVADAISQPGKRSLSSASVEEMEMLFCSRL